MSKYEELGLDFDYDSKEDWVGEFEFKWVENGELRSALVDNDDAYSLYKELFERLDDDDFVNLTVKKKRI